MSGKWLQHVTLIYALFLAGFEVVLKQRLANNDALAWQKLKDFKTVGGFYFRMRLREFSEQRRLQEMQGAMSIQDLPQCPIRGTQCFVQE
jgi:hypothetical protein